ncbi:MAG: 2-oxoacid:acceptor oxidoreductase family protein [Syntrophales bacterium]|nr:2-oxoacid:acceptor oxidoreductase family protein [Syntrophales bacterium]
MKKRERRIFFTGFGGQGIVMAGDILGRASAIYDGKHATMTQNYGPEARGGACSSQVIISDEEILYPYVDRPEILICMSQEGYTKHVKNLVDDGTLIWDEDLVRPGKGNKSWNILRVPATRIAEEMGHKMMANIVMLGFLTAVTGVASADAVRQAIKDSVPPATVEANMKAFERGMEYGQAVLKSRSKGNG